MIRELSFAGFGEGIKRSVLRREGAPGLGMVRVVIIQPSLAAPLLADRPSEADLHNQSAQAAA